jgi:hypothetical protein
MDLIRTEFITEAIKNNQVVRFAKFGDGEYACSLGQKGSNCDGDVYFPELSRALNEAFIILAQSPNTYLGMWHDEPAVKFYVELLQNRTGKSQVPWVDYHLLLRSAHRHRADDYERAQSKVMYNFVEAIRKSPRKKIYVCNQQNARICQVFEAEHLEIPENCWVLKYKEVFEQIIRLCTPDTIVLFSGGLCSKVAIADLARHAPTVTCLDVGSSFDCLARGTQSRSYQFNYFEEIDYYSGLLPGNWLATTPLKK